MFFEDSPTPSPVKTGYGQPGDSGDALLNSMKEPTNTGSNDMSETDDDSDLDIRRPLGRAARRMLGDKNGFTPDATTGAKSSPVRNDGSGDEDLYNATPMKGRRNPTASPSLPASVARSSLFVSPAKPGEAEEDDEDELVSKPFDSKARLAELVAQKRAERLAREAEEEERWKQRSASAHVSSDLPDEIVGDSQEPGNPDIERIMSDAAKPTRKASKRAMLEMERETQRLARQQALAHQMKTKKKFTTSDLFARFNFRPTNESVAFKEDDMTAQSAPHSDATDASMREPVSTPPSSPPTPLDRQRELVEKGALSKMVPVRHDTDGSLTSLVESEEPLPESLDVTKSPADARLADVVPPTKRGLKLARLGKKSMLSTRDDSSDDELEIVQNVASRFAVFDKAKGTMKQQHTDSKAIHTLKHLSHIGMDAAQTGRKKKGASRPSVNPQVLEAQLRLRAKEQARAQQLERIAELKAKGIEVLTSEEREREQEAFENLLEKARQDALELRKAEKAAAKGENGDPNASDDESEDEDYVDGSGSEDEEGIEKDSNELVDDAADESDGEEQDNEDEEAADEMIDAEQDSEDELAQETQQDAPSDETLLSQAPLATPLNTHVRFAGRKARKSRVIVDDDDEEMENSQALPRSTIEDDDEAEEDPFAAFGFEAAKSAGSLMSPTQAFNATMQTPTQLTQQESMDVLNWIAPPTSSSLPPIAIDSQSQFDGDGQVSCIPGSQVAESQPINLAWETQAPETPVTGSRRGNSMATNDTPGWQPTQDDGLPATWSAKPNLQREDTLETVAEDETQSTVPLRISESPVASAPTRKRLMRGQRAQIDSSDDEDMGSATPAERAKKDAFREMARKRREALTAGERAEAEREAKQMMDEQAEESEDEYAGLGGDDFVAPETEQDREMIDSSHVDVDERQLAAHFAERQRLADEAATSKLFKDITSGALRRKQGNLFDLDEDEDDLAVRRRQMRQREEARKRRLLLQDDNIAGLAEGKQSKGKDAFLKAIADDDDGDDELLDLSDADEGEDSQQTQSDSQPSQPILQEISGNKRRLEEPPEDRPPAKQRRTKASAFRAPTSMLEVKESLSFLLDEPHAALIGPTVLEDDSASEHEEDETAQQDEEEENEDDDAMQEELQRQNDGGFAPDRVAMPPPRLPASQRRTAAKPSVVDRLSLKRASSTGDGPQSRTAWAATSNGGFKVPSLLRRATTNTAINANDRGVTTGATLSRENSGSGVKMGGTKKSSLAYQARAEEQRAIVEASAKRRAENTARIAQLRRAASSGFGKDMGGRFE